MSTVGYKSVEFTQKYYIWMHTMSGYSGLQIQFLNTRKSFPEHQETTLTSFCELHRDDIHKDPQEVFS
ncbi:MAG: hypothetical protein A2161_16875 [Candidatus Schekmanbacteria bacterium RBG_13_48_7]|uniref:Uncharacterized protein n=1 Tax=Candidatus Schekmanbacteria bacterium RBG_13_48_7 TaxID=1817878 RepID=A0A1F7S3U9_9BACT|nr:MAG: hypothetical protein A2161_16875 [Candidatus Schekmanbacteria bacterium RBG_13_48_7]